MISIHVSTLLYIGTPISCFVYTDLMRVCTHGCVVAGALHKWMQSGQNYPEIIHRLIMHLWPHTVYHVLVLVQQSIYLRRT